MTSHYDRAARLVPSGIGVDSWGAAQVIATLALVDEVRGLRADLAARPQPLDTPPTPEPAPRPRVGDVLTTAEGVDAKAIVVDRDGDAWQWDGALWNVSIGSMRVPTADLMARWGPVTLVWLPSGS